MTSFAISCLVKNVGGWVVDMDLQAEGHISPYLCRDSIAIEGTGAGVMKSSHKQPARRVA